MVWMFDRRVGKNDGDSGWDFVMLLDRPLTDMLSSSKRVDEGACLERLQRLGARAGAVCGREGGGCARAGVACSALLELKRDTPFHD
ncbi:hypothetical protein DPMN_112925 [Dreissena polymorpha]|uniref:Uncharacterized protein n=1 Tax=Dreissena polymorpha TaxID=45954 RepID=A0A9D4KHF5_DREPO|nr:hypothetical protein DPMN_112925 [Dreissena polymorpha]